MRPPRLLAGLAIAAALALGGCAHQLVLTPADGLGPAGKGSAPMNWVSSSGELAIDLNGKHYAGDYVSQDAGGMVGFGTGFSGGQVATGTLIGASTSSGGKAYLTEPGGASLSCDFSYSSMSATGVGFCRCSDGKSYNLMIR